MGHYISNHKILKIIDGWLKRHKRVTEALVQWHGLPIEENTWESVYVLHDRFPQMNIEDKVLEEERVIDRPRRIRKTNLRYLDVIIGEVLKWQS